MLNGTESGAEQYQIRSVALLVSLGPRCFGAVKPQQIHNWLVGLGRVDVSPRVLICVALVS